MLLNDGMIKYHTTGDISTIQIEDGKGVTISSEGNIELLANNISLNGGEKIKLSAEKKIEMTCGGSSIVIDGEEEREDFKAMELYLESPFNVDVDIMPPSEVEKLFRAFAEERKRALPQFTPDGIPITLENKFDDAIYHYLYAYWKEQSGEYDPKDDEIIMTKENSFTKNEKKFEQWLLQQYGMTNKEQREYTVKGNLLSLGEIALSAWGIEGAGATKLVVPGKFIARNANNTAEKLYQTVIKSTPMNKPIKVKTNKGIEVEFVNPAGTTITWIEQSPKNIPKAIQSALNSKQIGTQIEGKVGDFVQQRTEITGFGLEIKNSFKEKVDLSTFVCYNLEKCK